MRGLLDFRALDPALDLDPAPALIDRSHEDDQNLFQWDGVFRGRFAPLNVERAFYE